MFRSRPRQGMLPGLSRFQNFHDDLIVLADRLTPAQFDKALNKAEDALHTEAQKLAKGVPPEHQQGMLDVLMKLGEMSVGDACLQTWDRQGVEICERFFINSK
eukprot:Gregarina_sp_Poly_1__1816@NODE_1470_length_4059_cov_108_392034_g974_i0_p7_GENE_NODE_1470_length_4059_cov_108_392034_g974_i0NODE_1470_length_4059_cov_108_392034_g974_i0_p7_ORF_typecomplete_len103_score15_56CCDC24/PF15669_5/0_013_NODE_1470_length_4059_cov_108_392034_g974_i012451553